MTFRFIEDLDNKKVYVQIENLNNLTTQSIRKGFFALGKDLKITANREILRKPKSGRTYILRTRNGARRRHVASAPGETHANLSGKLRRSLSWQVSGSTQLEFGYGVGKDAPVYGKFLENGTRRMDPRPSLANAIRETNRNGEVYFKEEFKKLIK